ncbi:MAG: glycosyltransferase family 2 protein [Lachnospiraceae bacterium]|nr:glycosyltransferase family 2 protein [Lachnospiraceae bacterium]MCI9477614.1 glycosyltransferase family 2 protein [Lachnospiraceae bacterium]
MDNQELQNDYKKLYEAEREKTEVLLSKIEESEKEIEELRFKLDRIKNSFAWKLSVPLRKGLHFYEKTRDRLTRYGSIPGLMRKVRSKIQERKNMKRHGTASFPTPEEAKAQRETVFEHKVKFSILVPLYNTPEKFLTDMLDSVKNQTYENWELCLADGSDHEHAYVGEICAKYKAEDSRIVYHVLDHNYGISGNTNECLKLASGDYIGLFDHDDILHPAALFEYAKAINETGADYIYCDEITFEGDSIDHMIVLHFKPDFAIDNLRGNNYICHFSAFSRELLDEAGVFRSAYDGSQDHDMILRLTAKARKVYHVPKALYYWRSHKASVAQDINAKTYAVDAAKRAVHDHILDVYGMDAKVESTRAFPTIFRIRYPLLEKPLISIVIPNKDHMEDLSRCVESIVSKSTYPNYEIIVVENNSETKEIFDYYKALEHNERIRVVKYEGDFNYSRINNFGVSFAGGKYVLLLNNDMKIITREWMEELLMYAQRPDVAAVGGKLYYADNSIQHAGIVIGLGAHRAAGHTHYKDDKMHLGYMGRLCYAQDVTAVTGACLLVERKQYEEVGGLDETFSVAFNDVDFCLKLRKAGYLNVFTPFCELFHYESKTRGMEEGEKLRRFQNEVALFQKKWRAELEAGDPYFNPNFSLDYSDYTIK